MSTAEDDKHCDEDRVAGGARWLTAAIVTIGVFNYGYALIMMRLLKVHDYSTFTAGQGLLLWIFALATGAIPLVLAKALSRARSEAERSTATRYAMIVSGGMGFLAALVVTAIALRFAHWAVALTIGVSAFIICQAQTPSGWLLGNERIRTLSALQVTEDVIKISSGLLLVIVAGLGDVGALASIGIAGLTPLPWWPRIRHGSRRLWLTALGCRDMWHSTIRLATAQGLVSLFTAIDVVMVSILPVRPDAAASYQASATVSRVPVWLAMGIGTAFFPSLSRRIRAGQLAGRAVQLYAIVALPLLAVLLTVPPTVLATAFPAKFGEMATLLKFTAVTGLASGGITLATAFFQAADDYAFLWWLGGGMGGFVIGLIGGWWLGGITGLAAGGAISVSILFILVGYRVARRQGNGVFAHVSLTTPAVSAVILVALRAYPVPWLIAAIAVGFLAGLRFLSGTASPGHARSGRIGLRQLVGRKAGEVVAVLRQHRLEEPDAVEPILGQHVPRAQPPSFTGIDDTRT